MGKIKRLLTVATLFSASLGWGRAISLDLCAAAKTTDSPSSRTVAASVALAEGVIRSFSLDAGAADVGTVAVGDELELVLFDNVVYVVELVSAMPAGCGAKAFLGEVRGCPGVKSVVVLETDAGLTIDINDFRKGRVCQVVSSPTAVTVREIKPETGRIKHAPSLIPDVARASDSSASRPPVTRSVADDGVSFVDVLVAYDWNAKFWVETDGGCLTNFAQLAVMKMNAVLANTDLDESFLFRLAGVVSLEVSASDVYSALYDIDDGTWGWDAVREARDRVGADVVTTLIDTGSAYGTTGLSWSLSAGQDPVGFSEYAYNVCAVRSVAQSHTMTHEVGHNMGAGHATAVNPESCDPGPQFHPYSAGYYFTGTNNTAYHTVMAYSSDGFGSSYTEAPFFSSPRHVFMGASVGDAEHDNTRTLAQTFRAVSEYRSAPVFGQSCVVTFDANGGIVEAPIFEVGKGSSLGILPPARQDGYLFEGWFTERTGGTEITALTVIEDDVTFYAHWLREIGDLEWKTSRDEALAEARAKHKRVILVSGRNACGNTSYLRETVLENDAVKRLVYDDFVLWFSDCDTQWYESRYYSSGLGGYTLPLVCVIDPADDESFVARRTGFMSAEDFTAFIGSVPKWEYTVVFHKNDGAGEVYTQTVKYGTPTALPGAAKDLKWAPRRGFAFMGWSTSEKSKTVWKKDQAVVSTTVKPGKTIHVYAIWQLKTATSYAIQYIRNDGSGKVRTVGFNGGERTPLNSVAALGFERRGYTFGGWATSTENARAKKAWRGDLGVVTQAIGNGKLLRIYAIWTLTPGYYSIRFNKNDGTGKWRELGYEYGKNTTLPTIANGLLWSREGYRFVGWATSAEKAAAGTVWRGDAGVTRTPVTAGKTLSLYAIWRRTGASVARSVTADDDTTGATVATVSASRTPHVSDELPPGYYSGLLADGTGTYDLLVDEGGEKGYVRIVTEDGVFEAEVSVDLVGDEILVGDENGKWYCLRVPD